MLLLSTDMLMMATAPELSGSMPTSTRFQLAAATFRLVASCCMSCDNFGRLRTGAVSVVAAACASVESHRSQYCSEKRQLLLLCAQHYSSTLKSLSAYTCVPVQHL